MRDHPGAELSDEALTTCDKCGQPVWIYRTPIGEHVALDDAAGAYLIDRWNKAYQSMRPDGYRAHHCSLVSTRAPLSAEVSETEFLWVDRARL